jgi:hypothetical protein
MVDVCGLFAHHTCRYCHRTSQPYEPDRPLILVQGIGIHESFNLNGRSALLAIGILDSISAGILLYSAFIQPLVPRTLTASQLVSANFFSPNGSSVNCATPQTSASPSH